MRQGIIVPGRAIRFPALIRSGTRWMVIRVTAGHGNTDSVPAGPREFAIRLG